ncbi:MAG: hypothetical protein H0X46_09365 [Bacteroidetes bacterium]|nr:hypothetical protein [Bacteroidota bacterium]
MKSIYQLLLAFLVFCSLSSVSCKKTNGGNSFSLKDAVITGYDQRACPCCGGFMINFRGETKSYTGQFYLIENDLSLHGITGASVFPLFVKMEYNYLEKCSGNFIAITKLTKK